jgi:hypothetical protein
MALNIVLFLLYHIGVQDCWCPWAAVTAACVRVLYLNLMFGAHGVDHDAACET